MRTFLSIVAVIVLSLTLIPASALAQTTTTDEIRPMTVITSATTAGSTLPVFPPVSTNDSVGQYRSTYGARFEIRLRVDNNVTEDHSLIVINSLRGESTVDAFTYIDPATGMPTISFTEADHWKYLLQYTPQNGGMFFGTLTNPVEEWTVRFNK